MHPPDPQPSPPSPLITSAREPREPQLPPGYASDLELRIRAHTPVVRHPPDALRIENVRRAFAEFVKEIATSVPYGRERENALDTAEVAMLWAMQGVVVATTRRAHQAQFGTLADRHDWAEGTR